MEPHTPFCGRSDVELSLLRPLQEGLPFVAVEEQGGLVRRVGGVLGVAERDAVRGAGNLDALAIDDATRVLRGLELVVLDLEAVLLLVLSLHDCTSFLHP